ncbi:hypothetical protein COCC4DRAFT_31760 [Bipolaris maydis ATCC 48331]|uniref:gamma-glutamylcyclotransferase n=2 Tax=Cochliobolus heterostrophus TaxID=5016 RepID=M2T0B7_COCH5|nr:uncharacterized protein COCC4DRAFT_31760 [Bipolaris maydis ATCC 48331]EMD91055.1 hypothetical protein COCHEDRAFT_1021799 [Bipolaris maydis C5]KAH7560172.1 hypothetical protein BM1_03806 [Bipolaris maydis]ENI05862.1 hypothetical protein COCC4DRAFT_31760 [Bipolaris maydis ATCC 48331]KAJ5022775.1 hypothetical protein J3E73DRAFT_342408 [Bipolaris maydis]KAJ5064546.1 gliotoxin biosynthesis protein GliK [Bipolaris maydis]
MPAFEPIPRTSQARLDASLPDAPLDIATLLAHPPTPTSEKPKTVLYLAYGSNLCNETFRGARGIRPLSQTNVVVPSLRLTFDLPGIPYKEPCFANTARRTLEAQGYHKDAWHKGLVGVVYEVTLSDYAHIIATEGGGSSYADILVDCHVLDPKEDTVPTLPTSKPFKAHTLFASQEDNERIVRPDPSYAQPSARYLKLITDGAVECELPGEYQEYLHGIRPFRITSKKQAVGKALFLGIWMPFVLFVFALGSKFSDEKGRAPGWLAKLSAMVFAGMWTSYDTVFKPTFGEGERTVGDDALGEVDPKIWEALSTRQDAEKECLLEESVQTMHTNRLAAQRPSLGG